VLKVLYRDGHIVIIFSQRAFEAIAVLEARLVASSWFAVKAVEAFDWSRVAPPFCEADRALLSCLASPGPLDPFAPRRQAILARMKVDWIFAGLSDTAFRTEWWTGPELEAVVACLSGILGKSIEDCAFFFLGTVALAGVA
jgi:hypothetical protein